MITVIVLFQARAKGLIRQFLRFGKFAKFRFQILMDFLFTDTTDFNIYIPTIEVSKIKETNNFLNYKFRTLSVNSFLGEKHFVSRCRKGCFSVRNGPLVLKEIIEL